MNVGPSDSVRWTKWWWLRLHEMSGWTTDEWRAFGAFMLTFAIATLLLSYPVLLFFNNVLELDRSEGLLIWLVLMWPVALPSVRGLTSNIFPGLVIRGDDTAAARLGGRVHLPTNEFWIRGFWWIDLSLARGKWSVEQSDVRARIFVMALLIFVPSFALLAHQLIDRGNSERVSAVIAFIVTVPPALFAGRKICSLFWPALVQKADDDAVKLIKDSVPPRQ